MRFSFSLIFALLLSMPANAAEAISSIVPNAKIVGNGHLSMAFWDIYSATLYAPNGKLRDDKPHALSIQYMRKIDGSDIADRSIEEMRKQGFHDESKLAVWNTQLKNILPDVEDGTVLSAVFIPEKETQFYHGNKQIGVIQDAEFTRCFSNIWLSENTSEPSLRQKLLGLS